tara:strand:- start:2029 stop:2238 length:210 start_codon:yes stop_codon:yes gene_type:complete
MNTNDILWATGVIILARLLYLKEVKNTGDDVQRLMLEEQQNIAIQRKEIQLPSNVSNSDLNAAIYQQWD